MSTEIVIPFSLTPSGAVNTTTDPNVQTGQHIECLVATEPSERVMMPTYGVPKPVFAPGDNAIIASLSSLVSAAMKTWEPAVSLAGVSMVPIAGDPMGSVGIEIDWNSAAPASSNASGVVTATILVGGTVAEGVSG